ncbi:hypothetical protein PG2093B_0402 [Bifidobacterium pseudolongum subsp. globosum]|uniref:Uncharacterized protein n=2 Tax=Bifidobacterium pseudolongum TaxID=1694 RepID=A0A4Q5A1L6_9BIFI|nr:hypothetical protein PG2093B_0402 [Bifidobacterium pseudolongum subsp. globosum]
MNIVANSQTLARTFAMDGREYYHIPPYQRPYS